MAVYDGSRVCSAFLLRNSFSDFFAPSLQEYAHVRRGIAVGCHSSCVLIPICCLQAASRGSHAIDKNVQALFRRAALSCREVCLTLLLPSPSDSAQSFMLTPLVSPALSRATVRSPIVGDEPRLWIHEIFPSPVTLALTG